MSKQTSDSTDPAQYIKVLRFSANGKLLAVGDTDGHIGVYEWPLLDRDVLVKDLGSEIVDIQFDQLARQLMFATANQCQLLDVVKQKSLWLMEKPVVQSLPCQYRAMRFGVGSTDQSLYLVLNAVNRKASFIQKYDSGKKQLLATYSCNKPITAFAIK